MPTTSSLMVRIILQAKDFFKDLYKLNREQGRKVLMGFNNGKHEALKDSGNFFETSLYKISCGF